MNKQQSNLLANDEQQPNLMDLIAAERDDAINKVEAHANPEWNEVAYLTAKRVAASKHYFISEDVWDALPSDIGTHEPRAMGAIMRRLRKEKLIEPTSQFVTSPSPLGHGRPSRVWKSVQGGEQQTLENHDRIVDARRDTERKPCRECETTTCSRRPGWPYCSPRRS